jgi:hypothetical protein
MIFFNSRMRLVCLILFLSSHICFADMDIMLKEGNSLELRAELLEKSKDNQQKKAALIGLSKLDIINYKMDSAIQYLLDAKKILPVTAHESVLLGDAYCKKIEMASLFSAYSLVKKCRINFEQAVKLEPDNMEALTYLADFYLQVPFIVGGSTEKGELLLNKIETMDGEQGTLLRIKYLAKQGKVQEAFGLAKKIDKKTMNSVKNKYFLARFFRDNKSYTDAEPLLFSLLAEQPTLDNAWYVIDSQLQLGEIKLLNKNDFPRAIELIEQYKTINTNRDDPNYFWSSWSLAQLYRETNQQQKYVERIKLIRAEDYSRNRHFVKEFNAATKSQKLH